MEYIAIIRIEEDAGRETIIHGTLSDKLVELGFKAKVLEVEEERLLRGKRL